MAYDDMIKLSETAALRDSCMSYDLCRNRTVTELREDLLSHPELQMSLTYDYGLGKLRFWRVNDDSISALDGVGNRVSFKVNSDYCFIADRFTMSTEYGMAQRSRMTI